MSKVYSLYCLKKQTKKPNKLLSPNLKTHIVGLFINLINCPKIPKAALFSSSSINKALDRQFV